MDWMKLNAAGYADDSAYLQAAVDMAHETGETLVIPALNPRTGEKIWILPRAILLPSNITILLDGCHIRHADGMIDNLFKNENARTPKANSLEGRQHDIRILGRGAAVLDGGVHNGLTEKTWREFGVPCFTNSAIHLQNIEHFEVAGFRICEPRYWCITLHFCAKGSVHDLYFDCSGHGPNQDGLDLRRGCRDIQIYNLTGYTGDDVVALTNLPGVNDMKCDVPELSSDICHVSIRNINGGCSEERGIVRLLCNNGTKIHDVLIEGIIDTSDPKEYLRAGTAIRLNENGYYRPDTIEPAYGDLSNITIRDVCTRARIGVMISCNAAHVLIDNVQLRQDAATALQLREGDFRHIRVRNLTYQEDVMHLDGDDNATEGGHNKRRKSEAPVEERKICAVYFQGSTVKDMRIDGLRAGSGLTSVFGGEGDVDLKVSDLVLLDESVPLTDGNIHPVIRD